MGSLCLGGLKHWLSLQIIPTRNEPRVWYY